MVEQQRGTRTGNERESWAWNRVEIWVWKVDLVRAQVGRVRMSWDPMSHRRVNEEAAHTRGVCVLAVCMRT